MDGKPSICGACVEGICVVHVGARHPEKSAYLFSLEEFISLVCLVDEEQFQCSMAEALYVIAQGFGLVDKALVLCVRDFRLAAHDPQIGTARVAHDGLWPGMGRCLRIGNEALRGNQKGARPFLGSLSFEKPPSSLC